MKSVVCRRGPAGDVILNYLRTTARSLKASLSNASHWERKSPLSNALCSEDTCFRLFEIKMVETAFAESLKDGNVKAVGAESYVLKTFSPFWANSLYLVHARKIKLAVVELEEEYVHYPSLPLEGPTFKLFLPLPNEYPNLSNLQPEAAWATWKGMLDAAWNQEQLWKWIKKFLGCISGAWLFIIFSPKNKHSLCQVVILAKDLVQECSQIDHLLK